MPLTRLQNDTIYNHILTVILQQAAGGLYDKALRFNDVNNPDVMSIPDYAIEAMAYTDDTIADNVRLNQRLTIWQKVTLKNFTRFFLYRSSMDIATPSTVEDWLEITGDDFNEYRRGPIAIIWAGLDLSDPIIRNATIPFRNGAVPPGNAPPTRPVDTA